jgi:(R,R)-butanediol dehydrogenase/meso-butanediol dehydrogenase/diacetyl reductase
VLECVGVPGLIGQAVDLVEPEGHVTVVGVCMEPDPWVPVMALMKEATLGFTVYYRPDDFARTIRAIAGGRLDPAPMVTGVVGLDEMPAAFEALRTPTDQVKVVVDPRAGSAHR